MYFVRRTFHFFPVVPALAICGCIVAVTAAWADDGAAGPPPPPWIASPVPEAVDVGSAGVGGDGAENPDSGIARGPAPDQGDGVPASAAADPEGLPETRHLPSESIPGEGPPPPPRFEGPLPFEGPPELEGPPERHPGAVMQAMESGQERLSRTVVALSRGMDVMLGARETYPDEAYDSVLRVRLIQRIDDVGGTRLEPDISGSLSLPGTEERLRIEFLSDDFEDPLDRERRADREPGAESRRSLALRLLQPFEEVETSFSIGLRSGPLDVPLRARFWRDFRLGELFVRPRQGFFWYDERGFGAATDVRIEHPIRERMLARSESVVTWFQRDEQLYYDQVFSLFQPLSRRRALLWELGAQGESEPNQRFTRYYVQTRLRMLVHRDWLIFELRPQLLRERDNDFELERRIYVGFELLFGHSSRVEREGKRQ